MGILTWGDWCEVFQNYDFFEPIIEEIFNNNDLGKLESYSFLTPGTNAVFRVNDYVVKIYVPTETTPWEHDEFENELQTLDVALSRGVNTPNIVCSGSIQKEQNWRYIVFQYINADDIGSVIDNFTEVELFNVVEHIKSFIGKYHIPGEIAEGVITRGVEKEFWNVFSFRFKQNVLSYLSSKKFEGYLTHGDLTGENILYNGDVTIIDFADSCITPKAYEYPPIVFDLLNYNLDAAMQLVDNDFSLLIDLLVDGVMLHEYGGDMLQNILKRLHIDPIEMIDVEDVKNAIIDILK